MDTLPLAGALQTDLGLTVSPKPGMEEIRSALTHHINHLISHDFEKLVYYLYRIDVDENRMRALLAQKEGENAAGLIADLIIERQLQKIKSRQQTKNDSPIPDDEKW